MTEKLFDTEAEALRTRREYIDAGYVVSLVAYDPARNVYAFDVTTPRRAYGLSVRSNPNR